MPQPSDEIRRRAVGNGSSHSYADHVIGFKRSATTQPPHWSVADAHPMTTKESDGGVKSISYGIYMDQITYIEEGSLMTETYSD